MNKTKIQKTLGMCFIILLMILVSCSNLTIPKKITIQADPEIQASFGKLETSLTDYFSVEKFQELVGESEDFTIYDYKHDSNDNTLRFLAKMDYSMEIEGLDVEGNLKDLEEMDPISFGYEEDGVTPSVLFTIPEINQTIDVEPISLNFDDEIATSIKDLSGISFEGVEPGTIKDLENQNLPFLLELCDDEFDTITFGENSTLDVTFKQIDSSSATTLKINGIAIFDALLFTDGNSIAQGGEINLDKLNSLAMNDAIVYQPCETNLLTGENLSTSLILADKTLPKDICIVINVTFKGGADNTKVTISTENSKFSDLSFKKITGFTRATPIVVDFPEIDPISLADIEDLKGAVIGTSPSDGNISFNFTNLPQGIEHTTNINISQPDDLYETITYSGLNLTNQQPDSNGMISLANQNLNTKDISVTGSIEVTANDATIDFSQTLKVSSVVKINKFASLSVVETVIPQDVLSQEYSYSLADVAEYVNKITFNEVGMNLNLCNGLPFNVDINVSSSFLDMINEKKSFDKNQTELVSEKIVKGTIERDISDSSEFDVDIVVDVASSNGVITFNDVECGSEYKFFGNAELVIDWESVNFILPDDAKGFNGSFPEEGDDPIDLSALSNIMGENLSLSGIKPYLYISSDLLKDDGPLKNATINTKFKASYTDESGNKVVEYLVGSESEYKQPDIVDMPVIIPDENSLYTGNLSLYPASLEIPKFADLLTKGISDLKIEYETSLGDKDGSLTSGIPIEKSELDGLSSSSEIKISILIDLPIIFTVKANENAYAAFDIVSLMKENSENSEEESTEEDNIENEDSEEESDLFGREAGDDLGGATDIFEFIESVGLKLDYENNTGLALSFVIQDENERGEKFEKTTLLNTGKNSSELELNTQDAQYIKNTNPFYPDVMEIRLPGSKTQDTSYTIKRDANVKVTLQGSVKTDIDYTINLDGSETNDAEGEN